MFSKTSSKPISTSLKRWCCTTPASQPHLTLNTGAQMPAIAFGTWKTQRDLCATAVETAIASGYRNIDAANDYNNEDCVGEGISRILSNQSKYGISRDDLFIQCKLWNTNHRAQHVMEDLDATLEDLQLDYVDSFVIHWPQAAPASGDYAGIRKTGPYHLEYDMNDANSRPTMFPVRKDGYYHIDTECHFIETWVAMQECVKTGKARSIGLSNFTIGQMNELIRYSDLNGLQQVVPTVLQVECHPYLQQKDLLDYCNAFGIAFQAYSTLGSGETNVAMETPPDNLVPQVNGQIPLKNPVICEIAAKYGKSPAQTILRWALQRGISFVSKSANPERVRANLQILDFELTNEEMRSFDSLNIGWRHCLWPQTAGHPDYPFKESLPFNYEVEKAPVVSVFNEFTMAPEVAKEQARLKAESEGQKK